MGDPYRSDPVWRVCPRCAEVLDEVMPGGHACPRCAGAWLAQPVVAEAFHDPTWPRGSSMWWRAELSCPECRSREVMDAIEIDGVIVDRCVRHGVWFDAGELARLMRGEGLPELRARVGLTRDQIERARGDYEKKNRREVSATLTEELRARSVELQRARDEVQRLEAEVDRLRTLISDR